MWTYIHTRLQETAIYLWPLASDCRALVSEAEMDSSRMNFDEPPALRWESVILQGDKQRSLDRLAPVMLARYPNNPSLQIAVSPWIHGNPEETSKIKEGQEEMKRTAKPDPALSAPNMVVLDTPTATITAVQKVAGTNVDVELVPVVVPKEYAEDATVALVATINSLRRTIAQHDKDLQELKDWRHSISSLSRAEVAVRTGANEPGQNRPDDRNEPSDTGGSTIRPASL